MADDIFLSLALLISLLILIIAIVAGLCVLLKLHKNQLKKLQKSGQIRSDKMDARKEDKINPLKTYEPQLLTSKQELSTQPFTLGTLSMSDTTTTSTTIGNPRSIRDAFRNFDLRVFRKKTKLNIAN